MYIVGGAGSPTYTKIFLHGTEQEIISKSYVHNHS